MKKLLLSLGTVAAIAAPVASVIACGQTKGTQAGATVKDKTLNGVPALKALGAKDATYTNTVKMTSKTTGTGTLEVTFTATVAGALDGVTIDAGSKVIVSMDAKTQKLSIDAGNGATTFDTTGDVDHVWGLAQQIMQDEKDAKAAAASLKTAPAGMGAALKGVKTLDVTTVQGSKILSAQDKKDAIAKINAAADLNTLTAFMATLTL